MNFYLILACVTPGLIAIIIFDHLVNKSIKLNSISFYIKVFLFSSLTYFLTKPWFVRITNRSNDYYYYRFNFLLPYLTALLLLVVLLAYVMIKNKIKYNTFFVRSNNTISGNSATWIDVIKKKNFFHITFNDETELIGYVEFFSENSNEGLVYVKDYYWLDGNDKIKDDNYEGIMIKLDNIKDIQVLKRTQKIDQE